TMITPVLLARRWTRAGSDDGRGGGPAGRAPRRLLACSGVSGLRRVRSSSRLAGSKNMRVCSSMRIVTPGEDLGGVELLAGQRDQAGAGHAAVCLDRVTVFGRRQWRGGGRDRALGGEPGQVVN